MSNIIPSSSSGHIALFAALSANACGHAFILITVPTIGRNLGFTDLQSGLLIGLSALLLALAGPIWGTLSDRRGRRPFILLSLIVASAFPALFAALLHYQSVLDWQVETLFIVLLGARILQAGLSAGLMPAVQAWLADHSTAEKRAGAMAFMGSSFGFGSICGAGAAWVSGGEDLDLALAVISLLILFSFITIALKLQDRNLSQSSATSGALPQINFRQIIPFLCITFLGLSIYGLLNQVTPLRLLDDFHLPSSEASARSGMIIMLTLICMVLMQSLVARKQILTPDKLVLIGASGALMGMLLSTIAISVSMLSAATMLLGASLGLLIPGNLALLSLSASQKAQARAAGINAVAQGIGMATGPILGAALHKFSPQLPYLLACFLVLSILGLALWIKKRNAFAI